ncbi:hypothetical protein HK097_005018 [Rhizophlyctis rosea]|uniref:Uncharacterized protein n=1 Tax=Rhizophlyctis rosea TaxID=64517 RepID=A0AAD5SDQ2_9FUNG|nr:hypothetical protein HK097_005018 [Rhizophlyctis rosea]
MHAKYPTLSNAASASRLSREGAGKAIVGSDNEGAEYDGSDGSLVAFTASSHSSSSSSSPLSQSETTPVVVSQNFNIPALWAAARDGYHITISNIPRIRIGQKHTANISNRDLLNLFVPDTLRRSLQYAKPIVTGRETKGSKFTIEFEMCGASSVAELVQQQFIWRSVRGFGGVRLQIEKLPEEETEEESVDSETKYPHVEIDENNLRDFLRSTNPRDSVILIGEPITPKGHQLITSVSAHFRLHKTTLKDGKHASIKLHNPIDAYATSRAADILLAHDKEHDHWESIASCSPDTDHLYEEVLEEARNRPPPLPPHPWPPLDLNEGIEG